MMSFINPLLSFILMFICGTSVIADTSPTSLTPTLTPVAQYENFIFFGVDPLRFEATKDAFGSTRLLFAAAVAARGNDLFVADTGQQTIFHIDRAQNTISKFVTLTSGQFTALYLAQDLTLYVADRNQHQVVQYARDGRLLKTFRDPFLLSSPVDVAEAEGLDRVLIADELGAHIIEYSHIGAPIEVIGQDINIPDPLSSITAMAVNGKEIFLLDNLAREVHVINSSGELLYRISSPDMKQPMALAVDECQRIFVADRFDNSIYVFHYDNLLTVYKNENPGLSGFQYITDLWIDNNYLYVADGPTGRIKVFLIEGDCH